MGDITLHRRESLILTAIDVINERGIQGLSVREVAKRQGISNASIFSHFKSKSELILSVLEHYTQYDAAVIQAIKLTKLKSIAAIKYFVDSYYTYYENYPQITAIVLAYDGLRCEKELSEKIKNILSNRSASLIQMIEEAQAVNEIRTDIISTCISDVIVGSCREVCLKWRVEGYTFPLKEQVMYTLNGILDSFTSKKN
jgi:AcrR family transcriptional regulator